jgi:DNA-binding Xre family transcriptional regulator
MKLLPHVVRHFTRAPAPRGPLNLARSYNFTEKHECIDELRTMIADSGLSIEELADRAGVHHTTIYLWLTGKTRRPQTPTLNAVGRVLGRRIGWVYEQ